jgi:hypothetical protein
MPAVAASQFLSLSSSAESDVAESRPFDVGHLAGTGMIPKRWRDRLIYSAMSLFLGWHTIAIMLAPVPANNVIVQSFRALFHPYLTLSGVDTTWDFFSPIGIPHQFRYLVEDAEGNEYTFTPITDVNWFIPTHRWSERIYTELMRTPEAYSDYFTKTICRRHASLKPVAISFLDIQEEEFWPEDYLLGKHRTRDPEYFTVNTLLRAECPQE